VVSETRPPIGYGAGFDPEPTVNIPFPKQPWAQNGLIGARNGQSAGPVKPTGTL